MRVTAIPMGDDLCGLVEREAAQVGVSVSQHMRDAGLARASAAATARGEDPLELLAYAATGTRRAPSAHTRRQRERVLKMSAEARDVRSDAQALRAESEQTRSRVRQRRESRR
jgi:hypothetical protein